MILEISFQQAKVFFQDFQELFHLFSIITLKLLSKNLKR